MKKTLIALTALVACTAFADKITLKSGSVLTGTVLGSEGDTVKIKTDDFGELTVKRDAIVSVFDASTKPMEVANIAPVPKPPETWHGSLNFAFSAARGNTFETSGSVIANLNRRWECDRLNLDFGYYYTETGSANVETAKTTDRWEAEAKHDHFWSKKFYHYEDLRYERDVIQQLNARYRAGLGGGYQWLEKSAFASTGVWNFNQELGVNYIKEEYVDNDDANQNGYCALRYAHKLGWEPKWRKGLEFFHNLEVLPQVDEWSKFTAKADVGFTTKIILDFDLIAKIEWVYDSKPAEGRKPDDLRYIVGLGYKW